MRGFALLLLGSASAVLGQEARQRMLFVPGPSEGQAGVFLAAAGSCAGSETTCETGCMPSGGVCCGDGTNTYCPAGTECRPSACCPPGKHCLGGGGPPTCGVGRVLCGSGCMPLLGDCCNDGTYCPAYSQCSANGCAANVLGGGGFDGGGVASSSAIGGSDDGFPTATAFTSEPRPRPTPTPSGDEDSGDAVTVTQKPKPTVTVADDESSADYPTTAAGGTAPTTTVFQLAGGRYTADGKLAAGLAMAAAVLL